MVAPKGPGHLVRSEYKKRRAMLVGRTPRSEREHPSGRFGTPTRWVADGAGIIETNFREETETDLFERAGGLVRWADVSDPSRIRNARGGGVCARNATYSNVSHEVKLIVDLIYRGGIANMRYSISTTAKYGDITRGPACRDGADKAGNEEDSRRDSRSGQFATKNGCWRNQANCPCL